MEDWQKKAMQEKKNTLAFLTKLKSKRKKEVDEIASRLHDEAFQTIDCLDCANCCKGLGPRMTRPDIKRLAKHLKMKENDFEEAYIKLDSDGDLVMKTMPCPFLMDDNYCSVYDDRPKACREYPHTDMDGFASKPNLHTQNTVTCPAAYQVVERMKELFKK